jgi:hypothetical protein
MNKALSIVIIVMALVIAIVPMFTDCQSQGRSLTTADGKIVAMKCHWSGLAEVGAAVPLGLTGAFGFFKQNKKTSRILSIFGVTVGALAILFPTVLIGVCANPSMICNMIMKPTLIAAGSIAIVASGILFVNARDPQI